MTVTAEIQGLFNPASVAESMERLPALQTSITDTLFSQRVSHPFVSIGLAELETVVGTMPLVRRGGQPVPIAGQGDDVNIFAPRPLKPSVDITAAELNDLKMIWGHTHSKNQFIDRKVDQLRQRIRNTTEGMAAGVATTGKLVWPSRLDSGGFENYTLDYGAIKTTVPAVLWDDPANPPGVKDVYDFLSLLEQMVAEDGGGGNLEFIAGTKVFGALLSLAERWQSTAAHGPIAFSLEKGAIIIGGFKIRRMAERYQSPIDGNWCAKLSPDSILGYTNDSHGKIYYLAIDSMSNPGAAVEFYIFVEALPGDVGVRLIGQAKPLPSRNPHTLILAKVVS